MFEFLDCCLDNVVISWITGATKLYLSVMKELIINTAQDLKPASNIGLSSGDVLVLMTACFSLFGIIITFICVISLMKLMQWIILGNRSTVKGWYGVA